MSSKVLVALAAGAAFLTAAPSEAAVITISRDRSVMRYTAGPGERNQLLVSARRPGPESLLFAERRVPIAFGPSVPCKRSTPIEATCTRPRGARLIVMLGDRGDAVEQHGVASERRDALFGGPGDDAIVAQGPGHFYGGTGDDRLSKLEGDGTRSPLSAHLDGGAGNDRIDSRDRVCDLSGAETECTPTPLAMKDWVTCGPGRDRVIAGARDVLRTGCESATQRAR